MKAGLVLPFQKSLSSSMRRRVSAVPIVLPDPLARWVLDEASGTTATDLSGNGFNGTIVTDSGRLTDEARGTVLNFSGNDYVDCGDFFYSDVFTLSCWIKPNTTTSRNVLAKSNNPGITIASNELWLRTLAGPTVEYRSYLANGSEGLILAGATTLALNTWYHVCVVQAGSGQECFLYLNGVLEASATQSGAMANTASLFQIGVQTGGSSSTYWSGNIYDVRVYNSIFTAPQVQKLYSDTYVFDPRSLTTGTVSRSDDFTTLAAAAAVNARTLPVGGGTWVADAGWVGVGDGTVRSTTNGQAAKHNLTHADCKVRLIWHPGATGDNQVSIFCRDTQSTAFPRYGFLLSTYPAYTLAPPAQTIAVYRTDNYVFTRLGTGYENGFYEATILRGWNEMELWCVGTTISCYLNGTKIIEVTDAAYGTARSRWGFSATNQSNQDARVSYVDFTVLA